MTKQSKNTDKKLIVNKLSQETMNELEIQEFWQDHQVGSDLLDSSLEPDIKAKLQQARNERKSRNITLNLSKGLEQRLRQLAEVEGIGYQTLIKQFLIERTYQEEVRRGIVK